LSRSDGKVQASVWWDADGILMIKYFETGESITGEVHTRQLEELRNIIKKQDQ